MHNKQLREMLDSLSSGIRGRSMKLARGNRELAEEWTSDTVFVIIQFVKTRKERKFSHINDAVRYMGKIATNHLSNKYRRWALENRLFSPLLDVDGKGMMEGSDHEVSEFKNKVVLSLDGKGKEFFELSYSFGEEKEESIKFSDAEISRRVGISKATGSRIRKRIIDTAQNLLDW